MDYKTLYTLHSNKPYILSFILELTILLMGLNMEGHEKSSQKFGDILANSVELISLLKNSSDAFWGEVESILKERFLIHYAINVRRNPF